MLEIIDSFKWAMLLAILGNGLGLGWSNALQGCELCLIGGVNVDQPSLARHRTHPSLALLYGRLRLARHCTRSGHALCEDHSSSQQVHCQNHDDNPLSLASHRALLFLARCSSFRSCRV